MQPMFLIGDRVKLIVSECDGYTFNRPLGSKGTVYKQNRYVYIKWDDTTPGLCSNGGYHTIAFKLCATDTFDQDGEE